MIYFISMNWWNAGNCQSMSGIRMMGLPRREDRFKWCTGAPFEPISFLVTDSISIPIIHKPADK